MKYLIALLSLFLLSCLPAVSQNVQFESYRNGQPQFNTYADLMGGKTEPQQVNLALRYYGSQKITSWMITVKLDNDFTFNSYTVAAHHASLTFGQQQNQSGIGGTIPPPAGTVPLSRFQETPLLVSNSTPIESGFNRTFSFNLHIQGGNHLLTIPNNIYGANYIFTLYEMVNNTPRYVAASTSRVQFQINYVGNHGDQLVSVENGASTYEFRFLSANDLSNGLSITRTSALKVKSYQPHELFLKSAKEVMQSSESSHVLPVSVVKAHLKVRSVSANSTNLQIFTPISLQVWDQAVARFPEWSNEIVYDLTLSVPGNQTELADARGHYETYLYFVIVPL